MNMTKKLMTFMTLLLLAWLMPLDAFAANTTGDANNDGEVNIADVNAVIDVILGGGSNAAADVNGDGEINIADINAIIDIILGGSAPTPSGIETITVNGVSFNMVTVEGGTFTMGAADDDTEAFDSDKPAHQVTLSSYSIGQTEVTQALWLAVMGSNPSYFTSVNGFTDDLNRPVEMVSWDDCQEFITKLNQMTGKTFRLPTEAEWEYAARGGNKSQGYTYAGSNTLGNVAWYRDNAFSVGSSSPDYGTHAVATKSPNELGLYDMSGNVGEWCHDWWGDYSNDAQTNPIGPTSGVTRLYRGGCWGNIARYCRVSIRRGMPQTNSDQPLGLRLVINSNVVVDDDHEWVDLGLPSGTLWATCNIGATKPEDYGDYFAWGETQPKEGFYNWGTYKWCSNGSARKMTKYCTDSYYGTVDGKTELDLEDDAAYVNWGPKWHMPSAEQQAELLNNCISSWTSINGVYGRLVTGPNGNSLFLPASGYRWDGSLNYVDVRGQYWSRTLISDYSDQAFYLDFYSGHIQMFGTQRSIGQVVRAVRVSPAEGPNLYIEQRGLDLGDVSIGDLRTGELTIVNNTAEAMTLAVTVDAPFSIEQEESCVSSISIVMPSNTRDTVTVMFTATTPGEFTGNVTFQSPGLEGGQSIIPVHAHAYIEDNHEWVDLGLPSGTLWATMNVGANAPEESGDYFAWGETEPKENYDWSTYKWCNGTNNTLTKYCTENAYGTVDNRIELEPADDAAYVNWSPVWRMPSREQFDELRGNCTWQWTTSNDVMGYLVTGPNGNTLFFPAADFMAGGSLWGDVGGNYWSRTCFPNQSYRALDLNFYSWKVGQAGNPRSFGSTIRAVRASND